MSIPQDQLFDFALSLPHAERADLAFQLLQSLTPPGDEITSEEFGAELRERIEAHRRGDLPSFSLEESRAIVQQRVTSQADGEPRRG
jgi:putative addiction module component (TIGR02574 family)